jgi:calcium binding protein 39
MLSGDGEIEPSQDQVLQITLEICKQDVLALFIQNLPSLGWGVRRSSWLNVSLHFLHQRVEQVRSMSQVRKDLVHCWCILLWQKVGESYCCVRYIENHLELLDFLVGWWVIHFFI